jgi:hypothetical protein
VCLAASEMLVAKEMQLKPEDVCLAAAEINDFRNTPEA